METIDEGSKQTLRKALNEYARLKLGDQKKKRYKCPECGKYKLDIYEGGIKFKCWGCEIQGDIIDLAGYVEHIRIDNSTMRERAWHAANTVGIAIPGLTDTPLSEISSPHTSHTAPQTPSPAAPQPQPFSFRDDQPNQPTPTDNSMDTQAAHGMEMEEKIRAVIEQSKKRLADRDARTKYPEAVEYLAKRGISLETAKRAGVGYDPEWRSPKPTAKNAPFTRRIIFPYHNGNTYRARCIDTLPEEQKKYEKMAAKPTDNSELGLFFTDRTFWDKELWESEKNKYKDKYKDGFEMAADKRIPLFVVEGEFDALSISEMGHDAIAIGGTSGRKKLLDKLRDMKKMPRLILALDHDKLEKDKNGELTSKGQKAQEALAKELTDLGREKEQPIEFVSEDFMKLCGREREGGGGIPKDANEMLVLDKDALKKGISLSLGIFDNPDYLYDQEHLAIRILDGLGTQQKRVQLAPTGFTKLDKALDGGLYPGLYTLGAIPSLGKSTLALQIADNIAATGRDVLFFSLEMSKFELIAKTLSRLSYDIVFEAGEDTRFASNIHDIMKQIQLGEEAKEDQGKWLLKAREMYKQSPAAHHLYIHEATKECGANEIRQISFDHQTRKGQTPVIIVDYLQILTPHKENATDKANIDYSVKILKQLSRDLNTPVFVISSLNRDNYGEEITFKAFKESGAVEYGSDVLMGIQLVLTQEQRNNPEEVQKAKRQDPREIDLVILKNRNGALPDKIRMNFCAAYNCFDELGVEG